MGLGHNVKDGERTQDIRISQDITFDTMLLKPETLEGLKDAGFYRPSPIQLHGIPFGKCGFDLLLEAKSGTGKTAVFTVIALEKIDVNKGLQVIVLAPTREIAMQICGVIKEIGCKYQGLQVEVVMGGLSIKDDIEKFKKNVHIAVGSPGRLKHLIHDKFIDTSTVRMFILDEADKLMEKSFQADINYIYMSLPQQKQVIMSSATYPENFKTFINNYVQNPQHICPDSNNILLGIEQKVTPVKHNSNIVRQTQYRFQELLKILSSKQFKQCLIFCNYQARVGELHKMLSKEKWPAEQLYGQQEQTDRLDALKTLQEYKCRLLISTDLAARGIDASNVDLVINFEPPFEWQTYLHRIGRAGRFGSYGTAITILSEGIELNKFKTLLESTKLSFQLTFLWSNDPFSVEANTTHNDECLSEKLGKQTIFEETKNEPIIKDNYFKLPLAYNKEINEPLESFDDLNKSFKEFNDDRTIEGFSDLIQSFQSRQENNNKEINFVHINLLEFPENRMNHLNSERNNNDCSELLLNNKKYSYKHNQNDTKKTKEQIADTTLEINEELSQIDVDEIKCNRQEGCKNILHNSRIAKPKNTNDLEATDFNHDSTNLCNTNDKTENEYVSEGLQDYGLPTSFSSSKSALHKQNTTYNLHKNRYGKKTNAHGSNVLNCNGSMQETQLNKKYSKAKTKTTNEISDMTYLPEKSCRNYCNISDDSVGVDMESRLKYNGIKNMPKVKRASFLEEDNTNSYNEYNKQNYLKWYAALKQRVKQIEMIMYLHEINNL